MNREKALKSAADCHRKEIEYRNSGNELLANAFEHAKLGWLAVVEAENIINKQHEKLQAETTANIP